MHLPFPETVFHVRLDITDMGKERDFMELIWVAREGDGTIDLLTLFVGDKATTGLAVAGFFTKTQAQMQAHALMFSQENSIGNLFFAFWMILNTKGVPQKTVEPDVKLNKARVKNGKNPLLPYIAVDTETYITALRETERMESEGGGTHRSPRPHLRRAHLRHLQSGVIIPIQAMIVNGSADVKLAMREKYIVKSGIRGEG